MPILLFFEDYPYASENSLLRLRIRRALKDHDVTILTAKTVAAFERTLRDQQPDILVLDIMADAPATLKWAETDCETPSALTGIELLRRCRKGDYGQYYTRAPVYMRSARGESHVREACIREGATDYFKSGGEDTNLIRAIAETFATDATSTSE
jgi:CheY-like chemotaxis protein